MQRFRLLTRGTLGLVGIAVGPAFVVLVWSLWGWQPGLVAAGAFLIWLVVMAGSEWMALRDRWRPALARGGLSLLGIAVGAFFVRQFDVSYSALLMSAVALRTWQQAGRLTDPERYAMRRVGVGLLSVGAVALVVAVASGTVESSAAVGAIFGFCLFGVLSVTFSFDRQTVR